MIQRLIRKTVADSLFKGKVVIIYGPRQSGKTTLVQDILQEFEDTNYTSKYRLGTSKETLSTSNNSKIKQNDKNLATKYFSCDNREVIDMLSPESYDQLQRNIGNYDLIVIDEAQRVTNIGLKLKLLVDNNPKMQIIATGSASFDLANKIKEPLTGRFYEYELLPLSIVEIMGDRAGAIEYEKELYRSIIYGSYPDTYNKTNSEAIKLLNNLSGSYLYKDILELENLKKSESLEKIVKMLAFQIGNEVNLNEIAREVKLNLRTVESYTNLLEKAYVIFRLRAYSSNQRSEISRNFKVYFYDLGIRNSIVNNWNDVENRTDAGAIFENWCVLEKLKSNCYNNKPHVNTYFWRSYTQKEIDYIEEFNGTLKAFEFKLNKDRVTNYNKLIEELNLKELTIINSKNIKEFLI